MWGKLDLKNTTDFEVKAIALFPLIVLLFMISTGCFVNSPNTSKTEKPGELVIWSQLDSNGGAGDSFAGTLIFGDKDYEVLSKATLYAEMYAYRSTDEFYHIPMKDYKFIIIRAIGDSELEYYPLVYNVQTKQSRILPAKDVKKFLEVYNVIIKKCGVKLDLSNNESLKQYLNFVDELRPSLGDFYHLSVSSDKSESSNELAINYPSKNKIIVLKNICDDYYYKISNTYETPQIKNKQAVYKRLLLDNEKSNKDLLTFSIYEFRISQNGVVDILLTDEIHIPRTKIEQKS